MTTPSDPIELTAQLMAIDSTSGREGEVIEWLDAISPSAAGERRGFR